MSPRKGRKGGGSALLYMGTLSQLFYEYRPDTAPDIIERVVKDIDEIVRQTTFTKWQETDEGTREVRKAIRRALAKYGLAKDQRLFERAFEYVAACC